MSNAMSQFYLIFLFFVGSKNERLHYRQKVVVKNYAAVTEEPTDKNFSLSTVDLKTFRLLKIFCYIFLIPDKNVYKYIYTSRP